MRFTTYEIIELGEMDMLDVTSQRIAVKFGAGSAQYNAYIKLSWKFI
jgi:hypothetical protein